MKIPQRIAVEQARLRTQCNGANRGIQLGGGVYVKGVECIVGSGGMLGGAVGPI